MAKRLSGLCGDCRHYSAVDQRCALMAACQNELVLVKQGPETPCLIGKFEPVTVTRAGAAAPGCQAALFGEADPGEIIGLRAFARLVGVELASIQDAIDAGRISAEAVVRTTQGRKLLKMLALADWEKVHAPVGSGDPVESSGLSAEELEAAKQADAGGVKWGVFKTQQEALLAAERRKSIKLERLELEGKLHRDEDVAAVWSDIMVRFRTGLLSIPAKVAPIIVSMPKQTPAQIQAVLEAHLREALTELSRYDQAKIRAERKKRVKG